MALGFYKGYWDENCYFFVLKGTNAYTDGWNTNYLYEAFREFATKGKTYQNDGDYTQTYLLIPINLVKFNNDGD